VAGGDDGRGVKRAHLFHLFEHARRVTGHRDYVVIGSLSILGIGDEQDVPLDMAMSNDVDCYTRADPGRVLDAQAALGEGSAFHQAHGYYLDPVSPSLPTLPDGWEPRMSCLEHAGLRLWCLDPDDAAVSKYARGQPNDHRWIRAGLASGHVSLPKVKARLASTLFLDAEEEARVRAQVLADSAWLAARQRPATPRRRRPSR
jgi:hypothetical protein